VSNYLTVIFPIILTLCFASNINGKISGYPQTLSANTQFAIPSPTTSSTLTSTPIPTVSPTPDIESRILMLDHQVQSIAENTAKPPKDFWDILNALAPFISGVVVVIIGFIAANLFKKREIDISKAEVLHSYLPELRSKNISDKETALLLIGTLDPKLSTRLAEIFKDSASISALNKMAEDTTAPQVAEEAKSSLSRIEDDLLNKIKDLIENFDGQRIPGELFGSEGEIILPRKGKLLQGATDWRFDLEIGFNDNKELWLVEIKNTRISAGTVEQISFLKSTYTCDDNHAIKVWLIYFSRLSSAIQELAKERMIYISSVNDIEKLRDYIFPDESVDDYCEICDPDEDHILANYIDWTGDGVSYGDGKDKIASIGRCNFCNGISLRCAKCGAITGVNEGEYGRNVECNGGCGIIFRVTYLRDGGEEVSAYNPGEADIEDEIDDE